MGRSKTLTDEQVAGINIERLNNNWSVKAAARLNSVAPGVNNVTLYNSLKRANMITVKARVKKV